MKYLILAFVLSLSNITMASNWVPHSKIVSGSNQAFQMEETCKNVSNEKCYDIANYPSTVYSEKTIQVDDLSKPNYSKHEVESCDNNQDCQETFSLKTCEDEDETPIKNLDSMEVYCSKLINYDKKDENVIELDQIKVTAYQAELVVSSQAQALSNAKASVKVLRECLAGVIDMLVLRNSSKNLTEPQVESMVATYSPIMDLLHAVSANTAKTKISEVVADGTLVTEADKTALIAEINKCQGL